MSWGWAVRIPAEKAATAAILRLYPSVEVLEVEGAIWFRGSELRPEILLDVRKLPDASLFDVGDSAVLTPAGAKIPAGRLPEGKWVAIGAFFKLVPQPAALGGIVEKSIDISVVATGGDQQPSILLASWIEWFEYVTGAPLVRLRPLRFALCEDGRVLIAGSPLPPVRGTRYYEKGNVAVPCGFALEPAIDVSQVRALLGADEGEWVIFQPGGTWELISEACFIPATRANVRATAQIASSTAGSP